MTDTPLMVFIRDAIVNIAKNIYEALDFEEMHIRIIALFEYVWMPYHVALPSNLSIARFVWLSTEVYNQ